MEAPAVAESSLKEGSQSPRTLTPARQMLSELLSDGEPPPGADSVRTAPSSNTGEAVSSDVSPVPGVAPPPLQRGLSDGGARALERARMARQGSFGNTAPPPSPLPDGSRQDSSQSLEEQGAAEEEGDYWGISGIFEFNDQRSPYEHNQLARRSSRSRPAAKPRYYRPTVEVNKQVAGNVGMRREVRLRVIVDRVMDINLQAQTFEANVFVEASWCAAPPP